jgi:hypothetical protein
MYFRTLFGMRRLMAASGLVMLLAVVCPVAHADAGQAGYVNQLVALGEEGWLSAPWLR